MLESEKRTHWTCGSSCRGSSLNLGLRAVCNTQNAHQELSERLACGHVGHTSLFVSPLGSAVSRSLGLSSKAQSRMAVIVTSNSALFFFFEKKKKKPLLVQHRGPRPCPKDQQPDFFVLFACFQRPRRRGSTCGASFTWDVRGISLPKRGTFGRNAKKHDNTTVLNKQKRTICVSKCWLNCQLASCEALRSLEKAIDDPTPSWSAVPPLRLVAQKRYPSNCVMFFVFFSRIISEEHVL